MTIQELFVRSNQALEKVIVQISETQWDLMMPEGTSSRPSTLKETVCYHTYDDAWVPDILEGKTAAEVRSQYEYLLSTEDIKPLYEKFSHLANEHVQNFTDLQRIAHLSYGDFPVREYLQHVTSFRAFHAYDIALLIGADTTLDNDLVRALYDEFSPVIESYRQMGVFPPAVEVATDASEQTKLLAMVGRHSSNA